MKLFKKEIIRPLHLEHTDFYENVKNSPQHAVSYQMSATDDYSKALVEPETDIRNELGTGNISMSVYDLNKFFTSVLSGDIIPKNYFSHCGKIMVINILTAAVFTVEMIISLLREISIDSMQ